MIMTKEQFFEFLIKKGHIEVPLSYEHQLHLKDKKEMMYKQYLQLKQKGEL
jgi:hypothetical protein